MADNGDTIIDFTDLTWDPAGFYRFDLTSDRSNLVLSDGLGLVHLFGHGHDLTGSGGIGLDLNDTNYGIWVWDFDITGEFTYGVYGQNLTNSIFYEVDVYNANVQGYNLHGNNITIAYPDVANIGSPSYQGIVAGMALQGSDYSVYGANVWHLYSAYEAYAVGFNSTGGTGNVLSSSSLNGTGSLGWTFGIWSSNAANGVTIDGVSASNWTWGSGGPNNINIYNSNFTVAYGGNNATYDPSSTLTENPSSPGSGSYDFNGGSGRQVFIGTAANETFVGGAGPDVLQGFGGQDTFHFIGTDAIDVVIGFSNADDTIAIDFAGYAPGAISFQAHGTSALGSGPVVVQNQYEDTFYFDPDGAGSAAWQPFLYTPGATLTSADIIFV